LVKQRYEHIVTTDYKDAIETFLTAEFFIQNMDVILCEIV